MTKEKASSGFALLLVLWTLVILSAVALTFAASASTEVRASQDSWNDLQAERFAQSGHDFASYLETRMIGTDRENLAGLPVQAVVAGLKYRVVLDRGTIDLVLEGENGKFDLLSADEAAARTFWTNWTGDRAARPGYSSRHSGLGGRRRYAAIVWRRIRSLFRARVFAEKQRTGIRRSATHKRYKCRRFDSCCHRIERRTGNTKEPVAIHFRGADRKLCECELCFG